MAVASVATSAVAARPASAVSKINVVAAFYPVAYAAQRVGGERVAVTNLTPAGAEPHDLELTPKQVDEILDARVVFVMGRRFQPAVEAAARQRDGPTVTLLDRLPIETSGKTVREGDPNALDPHVWLDPVLMQGIVREVRSALTKADPKGRAVYARNADAFVADLDALDGRYRAGLARCRRHTIVTAHEAFGYLAHEYGLRQEGVAGLSPDAEPDPKRLAQLTDLAKREGVTVIFTETLLSPRIADTLAREVGVRTDVLDPLEGLTDTAASRGETYVSIMDTNLAKLRRALACT
ncbi:MAG: metal ABC transporter solute-binding protein, Zn/Mn family [Acidimicrobiia bacterium]